MFCLRQNKESKIEERYCLAVAQKVLLRALSLEVLSWVWESGTSASADDPRRNVSLPRQHARISYSPLSTFSSVHEGSVRARAVPPSVPLALVRDGNDLGMIFGGWKDGETWKCISDSVRISGACDFVYWFVSKRRRGPFWGLPRELLIPLSCHK